LLDCERRRSRFAEVSPIQTRLGLWSGQMRRRVALIAVLSLAVSLAACGGGGKKLSSASLKPRLLPAAIAPGFRVERTLDWSNKVDLVAQGIPLPEALQPSAAVKVIQDDGFRGAYGEVLRRGQADMATEVHNGVVKLSSAKNAAKLRDWMQQQGLRQPCFAACIFTPGPLSVPGVPGVKATKQVGHPPPPPPGAKLPGGAPAATAPGPTNYSAEFTIGPYLYFVALQADASAEKQFVGGVRKYYEKVKAL
jgi:hypothetical protein